MSAAVQPATDVKADFRFVKAMLLRCVNWSHQPDSLLTAHRKEVSGWSPAEHLEHVALANRLILGAIRALANAPEPDVPETVSDVARHFIAAGVIERGTRKHPDFVAPQGVALDYLRRELQSILDAYADLEPLLEKFASSRATFTHHVLGPLTAAQWLRFAGIHTRHHLNILRDIAGGSL